MRAEDIWNNPPTAKQLAVARAIAIQQLAGDDSGIDYSGIPPLTEEQLASMRRPNKRLVAVRLDNDIFDWLRTFGPGYSTRINAVLREVMIKSQQA